MNKKIILLVLLAILLAVSVGCSNYVSEPRSTPPKSNKDFIRVCEYRGALKECGYVDKERLERELEFLMNRARH